VMMAGAEGKKHRGKPIAGGFFFPSANAAAGGRYRGKTRAALRAEMGASLYSPTHSGAINPDHLAEFLQKTIARGI